jgi:cellulose 1,4-beta-cellobiosidase
VLSTHAVAPVRATADTYLEVGFMGTAMLAPSASSGEVRLNLTGANALSYDQANDYSFQSTGAVYVEAPRVTAYLGGTLAWGTEPP